MTPRRWPTRSTSPSCAAGASWSGSTTSPSATPPSASRSRTCGPSSEGRSRGHRIGRSEPTTWLPAEDVDDGFGLDELLVLGAVALDEDGDRPLFAVDLPGRLP